MHQSRWFAIDVVVIRFPRNAHAHQPDPGCPPASLAEETARTGIAPGFSALPDGPGRDELGDPGLVSRWPSQLNNAKNHPPPKTQLRTPKKLKRKRHAYSPVAVIADVLQGRPAVPKHFQVTGLDPAKLLLDWFGALPLEQHPAPSRGAHAPIKEPAPSTEGENDSDRRFWRIWTSNYDHFFRLSLKLMGGNRTDAEDALSTAMMKAHRAYAAGGIRNERAWLTSLVRNACMDQYRQRLRHPEISFSGEPDGLDNAVDPPPAAITEYRTPEDEVLAQEDLASLIGQLFELPETLLEPLMMRCIEERPYGEIASVLELSNEAVRKRIELARRRLKRALG